MPVRLDGRAPSDALDKYKSVVLVVDVFRDAERLILAVQVHGQHFCAAKRLALDLRNCCTLLAGYADLFTLLVFE